MPNREVHVRVGGVTGAGFATYLAWGQPGSHVLAEAVGGIAGGIGGGLLPDCVDTPYSPRHRAEAHSRSISGALGYFVSDQLPVWQASLRKQAEYYAQMRAVASDLLSQIGYGILEFLFRFLAGAFAGLLAGYASHLALDFLTPACLPVLC